MLSTLLVFALLAAPATAPAKTPKKAALTPSQIEEAIAYGKSGGKDRGSYRWDDGRTLAKDGVTMSVSFSTPFSSVAAAARQAAKEHRPFTVTDVKPQMLEPKLGVMLVETSMAAATLRPPTVGGGIQHVVLAVPSGGEPRFVQPLKYERLDMMILADFPLDQLTPGTELRLITHLEGEIPIKLDAAAVDQLTR